MARIIQLFVDTAAEINQNPRRVKCITLDDLATVTAAAWINPALLVYGVSLLPTDVIDMIYNYNPQTNSGTFGVFVVAINNGVVTLGQQINGGNVLLPVVANNLAVFNGTSGQVKDAGARIIANTTAAYAGGGTSNVFAATGLAATSKGTAVIRASTNAVTIAKALPGTNTLTVTFSADPGAGTTVDYIYSTAALL